MRLLDPLLRWEPVEACFSDQARLQGMLDFEAALARAEAATGLIPAAVAVSIERLCRAERFDFDQIGAAAAQAGNLAIPLITQLRRLVATEDAGAERFVHWGATSQDTIDTGCVLQLRAAMDLIEPELTGLAEGLAALAERWRSTPAVGRTWMQAAAPTTLGLRFAGWLDAIERQRRRLSEARARVLVLQFGGAVGTLAAFEDRGLEVAEALGRCLHLRVPTLPWHAHRDRMAEVATVMALGAGGLGKIARDIALHMQPEVGELSEPNGEGRGGSSTMPHKRNPVTSAVALSAALRLPDLAGTMLTAMVQEQERGLGGWQAEWEALPEAVSVFAGALHHLRATIADLEVDAERVQANLELSHGLIFSERVELTLAERIGRSAARKAVAAACRRAQSKGRHLRDILADEASLREYWAPGEPARLFEASAYLGSSPGMVDRVLARRRPERAQSVQAGDIHIRYALDGPEDAPVVVFAHSLGAEHRMWDAQVAALVHDYRLLRYDIRGHGGTSVTPGPYTLVQLGGDALRLMDALGIERAHFCGISLGGQIGLWLGCNAPERFHSLVLANTAARIGTEESWTARIDQVRKTGVAALADVTVERWLTAAARQTMPDEALRLRLMLMNSPPEGYAACCGALKDADLRQDVGAIRLPALVVAGTHDGSTPPGDARFLHAQISGSVYVELDAAHLSNIEARERFNAELIRFWKS